MRLPFNGSYPITLRFGSTAPPYTPAHPHRGTDYGTPTGVTLLAPQAGYAEQRYASDFGKYTSIDGERYFVILAHESSQLGNGWVAEGQPVGKSGATGWVDGPHVHVQVLDKGSGQWVNFEQLLNQGGTVPPDYAKVNDGDVLNWLRWAKQDAAYQPTGPELDHYKAKGWKVLAEDVRAVLPFDVANPPATIKLEKGKIYEVPA